MAIIAPWPLFMWPLLYRWLLFMWPLSCGYSGMEGSVTHLRLRVVGNSNSNKELK